MTTHLTNHNLTYDLISRLQNKKEVATSLFSSPTWKQSMTQNQRHPSLQVQLGLHRARLQVQRGLHVQQPQNQSQNRATFLVIAVDRVTKIEKLPTQKNRN